MVHAAAADRQTVRPADGQQHWHHVWAPTCDMRGNTLGTLSATWRLLRVANSGRLDRLDQKNDAAANLSCQLPPRGPRIRLVQLLSQTGAS